MTGRSSHPRLAGRRVLVTGASGYLASRVTPLLAQAGARVVCWTSRPGHLVPLEGAARVSGDLREARAWTKALRGIDTVLHFAAQTSHRVADEDPITDWDANVLPMVRLLEACRKERRAVSIVFAGTATQTGLARRLPVDESHPDDPLTIYDLHKLMAERYLKQYSNWGLVNGTTLRLPNLYGPGPASSSADRGILNACIRRALAGEPLRIYGRGNHVRDYLYVDDAAHAFVAAAEHPETVAGRHFVLGTGRGTTVAAAFRLAAARVAARTGRKVPVTHVAAPAPLHEIETRDFVAQPRAFTRATRWRSKVSLAEGIDRTMAHILAGAASA